MNGRKVLTVAATFAALMAGTGLARAQAVVVNCSFELEWCEAVKAKFEATTGLKAAISRKTDGEIMAQMRAEGDNPRFDVWHSAGPDAAAIMAKDGFLDSYKSPKLPELHDWAQNAAKASNNTLTPIYLGVIGFGYNADLLAKKGMPEPKCWADLTNPAYKNEIQMADPSTSGTAYTMVTTILQLMGEEKGWEYLKALHKNINQYTRSGTAGIRAAARGETTIGVAFLHDSVAQAVAGFPVKTVPPCEGTGFEMPGVAVIKGARNPELAQKWVDFVLSADGQAVSFDMAKYQIQSNKGAKLHPLAPKPEQVKISSNYDIMSFATDAQRTRILDRFEKEVKTAPK
jgi:iron(III) transport system substrate-binding protein